MGFLSGPSWGVGACGNLGGGSVLGCALRCAFWGHPRLYLSTNVAFGAFDCLVLGCGWARDSFAVFRVLLVISCSNLFLVGTFGMPRAGLTI